MTARGRKPKDSIALCSHDAGDPATKASAARQIQALRDVIAAEAAAGQAGTSDASDQADGHTGYPDSQETQDSQDIQRNTPSSATSAEVRVSSRTLWDLPLYQFLKHVVDELEGYDETYPPAFFVFVRMCKGYWLEGKTGESAFDEVEPVIRKLGGWPPSFGDEEIDGEEAYTEFVTLWDKVRYRPDETPLTNAAAKAKAYPLSTRRSTEKRRLPGYNRFVSLAGWLQVSMGDKPIMLPCRACAEVLKTTPRMVSLWRQWAIEDEFLVVIKSHAYHPNGKSEATVFRFDVGRWTCLSKVAQRGTQASFDYAEFIPNDRPMP